MELIGLVGLIAVIYVVYRVESGLIPGMAKIAADINRLKGELSTVSVGVAEVRKATDIDREAKIRSAGVAFRSVLPSELAVDVDYQISASTLSLIEFVEQTRHSYVIQGIDFKTEAEFEDIKSRAAQVGGDLLWVRFEGSLSEYLKSLESRVRVELYIALQKKYKEVEEQRKAG